MAKAKQELTVGTGQSIQEKDIPWLQYLQAVLKEWLHPAGPLLVPHSEMDVETCGYAHDPGDCKCIGDSLISHVLGQASTIYIRKVHQY